MLIFLMTCFLFTALFKIGKKDKIDMPPLLYSVKASKTKINVGELLDAEDKVIEKESEDGKMSLLINFKPDFLDCSLKLKDKSCGSEFYYEFFNIENRKLSLENKISAIDSMGRKLKCSLKMSEGRAIGKIEYKENTVFPVFVQTLIPN